jgi:hypothetical protein
MYSSYPQGAAATVEKVTEIPRLVSVARRSMRGEEFVLELREGANDLDWLLAEPRTVRAATDRVLGVGGKP